MFSPEIRKMKAECWRSPWRPVKLDPVSGHPTRYLMLSPAEMHMAAVTGKVQFPEHVARRYGLIEEPV